jgi:plastocyanin domain-containing protein
MAIAAAIALCACGRGDAEREAGSAAGGAATAGPAEPMRVDEYQVVRVVVRDTGYEPGRIRLAARRKTKIVFVQESDAHCAAQVRIPGLGVPVTDLPWGKETVVEFVPEKPGTYEFTCGMEMMRGTLEVTT